MFSFDGAVEAQSQPMKRSSATRLPAISISRSGILDLISNARKISTPAVTGGSSTPSMGTEHSRFGHSLGVWVITSAGIGNSNARNTCPKRLGDDMPADTLVAINATRALTYSMILTLDLRSACLQEGIFATMRNYSTYYHLA